MGWNKIYKTIVPELQITGRWPLNQVKVNGITIKTNYGWKFRPDWGVMIPNALAFRLSSLNLHFGFEGSSK